MTNSEYEEWGQTVIKEHTINNIDFINKGQKNAIITYFISKYGILDTEYSDIINEFLLNPFNVIYRVHVDISVKDIIELLLMMKKHLNFTILYLIYLYQIILKHFIDILILKIYVI